MSHVHYFPFGGSQKEDICFNKCMVYSALGYILCIGKQQKKMKHRNSSVMQWHSLVSGFIMTHLGNMK